MPQSAIVLRTMRGPADDEIGKIFRARMVSDMELKPKRGRTPSLPEEKLTGLEVPLRGTPLYSSEARTSPSSVCFLRSP